MTDSMKVNLVYVPDKRLKTVCSPVDKVDPELLDILDQMVEIMNKNDGCGLAGPQVGVLKRIFIADPFTDGQSCVVKMINPEILWFSEEKEIHKEGCLSIPEFYIDVERSSSVKVRYLDTDGTSQEMLAKGFLARIIQHETDHINGVLLIDRASPLKRKMAISKVQKHYKSDSGNELG